MAQKMLSTDHAIDHANFEDNTLKSIFYVLQSLMYTEPVVLSDQMIFLFNCVLYAMYS